ncbi:MAG: hypothetical protein GY705_22960 [Bacteroidetes bacterium]|nr:hypothetical protein [Bacteroidota bacterium]
MALFRRFFVPTFNHSKGATAKQLLHKQLNFSALKIVDILLKKQVLKPLGCWQTTIVLSGIENGAHTTCCFANNMNSMWGQVLKR